MGDSRKISSDKRIHMESYAVCKPFYSHGGLCRDREAGRSVYERAFLVLAEKMR